MWDNHVNMASKKTPFLSCVPVCVLDKGHIFFFFLEVKVKRKDLSLGRCKLKK